MKKVDIITILDVPNCGSMLQAYALGYKIEKLGHKVEFINYIRKGHSPYDKFTTFLFDKSLGNIVKRVCYSVGILVTYSYIMRQLRHFVTSRFSFTKRYMDIEELKANPPQADLYVTGSDQVWNSQYNQCLDKAFFLDFTPKDKISYAASMGMHEFPESEINETIRLLKEYKHLSVREKQTEEYFHTLGLTNTQHVLDPTLLINANEWKQIVNYVPNKKERYLLVYSVERANNDFIFSQAQSIAHELGLKMYVLSATYPVKANEYHFDKIFALANIKTFISLLADADFVVASSFHGTAFSVNFNKDFITISADKYNIRMESLVKQFGISHRIVSTTKVKYSDLKTIDYKLLNTNLEHERLRSLNILQSFLN